MKILDTGHIVEEPDVLGGKPHIVGHRISVAHIATWIVEQHETPEAIAEEFHLTLGKVHPALAYYHDHREEIDREIVEAGTRAKDWASFSPGGGKADV